MSLVDRAKNIIISPKTEWEVIKGESISIADMFKTYAVILAVITPVAGFIGRSLVGISFLGVHTRVPFFDGIFWAILYYAFSLVAVFVLGYIIDALAPSFGSRKDINASMKVAVYSMTASWIAGIFSLIPALSALSIVGLYSFYLLFLGMRSLKEVPQEKMVGYFLITLIVAFVLYIIIGVITASIAMGGGYGYIG